MSSPEAMAAYYKDHPKKDDPTTWGGADNFNDAKAAYETAFIEANGPIPTPSPVPGPPSPGAGMPAARLGDLTAHGGTIGPVVTGIASTVMIGYMPAACMGDAHICPMFSGPKPHGSGTITKGSATVKIGNKPAARISDLTVCTPEPGAVAKGEPTVMIGDAGGGGGGGAPGGGPGGGPSPSPAPAPTPEEEAAPPPQTYAQSEPPKKPPAEPKQVVDKGTHWLEIELVDEDEQPVAGESYIVKLPNGKEARGGLDAKGLARIQGIKEPGACGIKFPDLDSAVWTKWQPTPQSNAPLTFTPAPLPSGERQPSPIGSTPQSPASPPASVEPVRQGPPDSNGMWKKVMQGECISSIAADAGHLWKTIWDHPSNAKLVAARRDPNVLMPGDAVYVPKPRPKEEPGNTDARHKFKRKGEPCIFRAQLIVDGKPLANLPYELTAGGVTRSGTTGLQGQLAVKIPGNARRGVLSVQSGQMRHVFELRFGELDPVESTSGIEDRLSNLACDMTPGGRHGLTPLQTGVRDFQSTSDLPVTGNPDAATREKLKSRHGS